MGYTEKRTAPLNTGVALPKGFALGDIVEKYTLASREYSRAHRRAYKLDAADRGRLWEAVNANYPAYQILPDSNFISYIKSNLAASIYTVGKSAKLIPTSDKDKEIVEQLNIALEHIWDTLDVASFQYDAGERAALINIGITQVGWDNNIITGTGDTFQKGQVTLKNINPLHFYRDPYASSLDTASWCCTWEKLHKSVILGNPKYRDGMQKYLDSVKRGGDIGVHSEFVSDKSTDNAGSERDYYTIYQYWVNDNGKIHEIHIVNNSYVLAVKENIKPAMFPFAILYCNTPAGDLFGTSECARAFANNLAYNIMNSIVLTAEYKNQRPPRMVSGNSGINVATFTKHGNDADRTFIVNGDASKAVHYVQFPTPSPQALQSMSYLAGDIKNTTGVDDRYTGRDTGSVLTTGGVESMLDQVTMIDSPKVINYERYCKQLTKLIIYNYLHFGMKRKYFTQDMRTLKWRTVEVDFPTLDPDTTFAYSIAISSDMPKNKTRMEAMANHLMEMQMQYQGQGIEVDLITPEEWLMLQDIPMREYFQERMGIQRTQNWTEMVAQTIAQYTGMVQNGVEPDDAIAATADTMARQQQPGTADTLNAVGAQMQDMQTGMMQTAPTGGVPIM